METVYGCDVWDVTHRFLVTLVNGDDEMAVDLHVDSGSFTAVRSAIRKVYPPSWSIYESLTVWEDCF